MGLTRDAWFWAQGLTGGELRGTSAFGLVAIATPGGLEVTPGVGSARALSGAPAYQASGRATWTQRFENGGAPVTIAGAPAKLDGPVMNAAVEVFRGTDPGDRRALSFNRAAQAPRNPFGGVQDERWTFIR